MSRRQQERNLASWPGLRGKKLRYVLLRHTPATERAHYDLMLELRAGRGPSERTLWGLQSTELPARDAERLEWRTHRMHRRRYLTFEGEIGGNRGKVKRVDAGTYSVSRKRGLLQIVIRGTRLQGSYVPLLAGYGRHVWVRSEGSVDHNGSR